VLIVMGSSLAVEPVSRLPHALPPHTLKVLVNRERLAQPQAATRASRKGADGVAFAKALAEHASTRHDGGIGKGSSDLSLATTDPREGADATSACSEGLACSTERTDTIHGRDAISATRRCPASMPTVGGKFPPPTFDIEFIGDADVVCGFLAAVMHLDVDSAHSGAVESIEKVLHSGPPPRDARADACAAPLLTSSAGGVASCSAESEGVAAPVGVSAGSTGPGSHAAGAAGALLCLDPVAEGEPCPCAEPSPGSVPPGLASGAAAAGRGASWSTVGVKTSALHLHGHGVCIRGRWTPSPEGAAAGDRTPVFFVSPLAGATRDHPVSGSSSCCDAHGGVGASSLADNPAGLRPRKRRRLADLPELPTNSNLP